MIKAIYIKNFKAYEKEMIRISENNLFIGQNDSGKSTILEALDIFFNTDNINRQFVRNDNESVEIGVLTDEDKFYKKIYSGANYRLNSTQGNIDELNSFKYIYIPVRTYDCKKIIEDLAAARAIQNTDINNLQEISQNAINEVISSIDNNLIIMHGQTNTSLIGKQKFKYDSALKFSVESEGIPIESRGSGYQKNLMYAFLTSGYVYENVILAIDEIENSMSINNVSSLINVLHEKFLQTLFTTHSRRVVEIVSPTIIKPIYNGISNHQTELLANLLETLDTTNEKYYLIVEGKNDVPWIIHCLHMLERIDSFILIPGGGCDNSNYLKVALEQYGKKCIIIKDGDTNEAYSLSKECIELYIPLDDLNRIFDIHIENVPQTKDEFFDTIIRETPYNYNKETIKELIANHVPEFLNNGNELINEVKTIIDNQILEYENIT